MHLPCTNPSIVDVDFYVHQAHHLEHSNYNLEDLIHFNHLKQASLQRRYVAFALLDFDPDLVLTPPR